MPTGCGAHRIHFLKNLGLFGGLLIVVTNDHGV